jgi:AraC-like DNA-binding protein
MSVLYLGIGRSIFVGPHLDQELHRHATLQITLSLTAPFFVKTPHTQWSATAAVAIAPGVPHQMRGFSGEHVTLLAVPESRRTAGRTEGYLSGQPVRLLGDEYCARYREFFAHTLRDAPSCARVFRVFEEMIDDLTGLKSYRGLIDERILRVLEHIQNELSDHISLGALAADACLSRDRFLHLFKEQLGLPLRQYILQQRVHSALQGIVTGRSLTEAALDAGFTDASHFTHRFVQYTGLRPSLVKKFRGTVRVLTCMSSRCVRPSEADPEGIHCGSCTLQGSGPVTLDVASRA